jgi:hypothetical protein
VGLGGVDVQLRGLCRLLLFEDPYHFLRVQPSKCLRTQELSLVSDRDWVL